MSEAQGARSVGSVDQAPGGDMALSVEPGAVVQFDLPDSATIKKVGDVRLFGMGRNPCSLLGWIRVSWFLLLVGSP